MSDTGSEKIPSFEKTESYDLKTYGLEDNSPLGISLGKMNKDEVDRSIELLDQNLQSNVGENYKDKAKEDIIFLLNRPEFTKRIQTNEDFGKYANIVSQIYTSQFIDSNKVNSNISDVYYYTEKTLSSAKNLTRENFDEDFDAILQMIKANPSRKDGQNVVDELADVSRIIGNSNDLKRFSEFVKTVSSHGIDLKEYIRPIFYNRNFQAGESNFWDATIRRAYIRGDNKLTNVLSVIETTLIHGGNPTRFMDGIARKIVDRSGFEQLDQSNKIITTICDSLPVKGRYQMTSIIFSSLCAAGFWNRINTSQELSKYATKIIEIIKKGFTYDENGDVKNDSLQTAQYYTKTISNILPYIEGDFDENLDTIIKLINENSDPSQLPAVISVLSEGEWSIKNRNDLIKFYEFINNLSKKGIANRFSASTLFKNLTACKSVEKDSQKYKDLLSILETSIIHNVNPIVFFNDIGKRLIESSNNDEIKELNNELSNVYESLPRYQIQTEIDAVFKCLNLPEIAKRIESPSDVSKYTNKIIEIYKTLLSYDENGNVKNYGFYDTSKDLPNTISNVLELIRNDFDQDLDILVKMAKDNPEGKDSYSIIDKLKEVKLLIKDSNDLKRFGEFIETLSKNGVNAKEWISKIFNSESRQILNNSNNFNNILSVLELQANTNPNRFDSLVLYLSNLKNDETLSLIESCKKCELKSIPPTFLIKLKKEGLNLDSIDVSQNGLDIFDSFDVKQKWLELCLDIYEHSPNSIVNYISYFKETLNKAQIENQSEETSIYDFTANLLENFFNKCINSVEYQKLQPLIESLPEAKDIVGKIEKERIIALKDYKSQIGRMNRHDELSAEEFNSTVPISFLSDKGNKALFPELYEAIAQMRYGYILRDYTFYSPPIYQTEDYVRWQSEDLLNEKIPELRNMTGIEISLDKKFVADLYIYCLMSGSQNHYKLPNIADLTGIEMDDEFIYENIINDSYFSARVELDINIDLYNKYFAVNRPIEEYIRIYDIFECNEYYKDTLTKLEKEETISAKETTIKVLTALALKDDIDHEEYVSIKNEIRQFSKYENHSLDKIITKSLAKLAERGDQDVLTELIDILKKVNKDTEDEKRITGLTENQTFALRVFFELHSPYSNELLLSLLFTPNINPRIKKLIAKNLLEKKTDMFSFNLQDWFSDRLALDSKEVDWSDLKYYYAILKIPSADLRNKADTNLDTWFHLIDPSGSISLVHQKECPSVPDNVYIQLSSFTLGDEVLTKRFENLYRNTRGSEQQNNLLFGITNIVDQSKEIRIKVAEYLKGISSEDFNDAKNISDLFKRITFLNNVKNSYIRNELSGLLEQQLNISELNENLNILIFDTIKNLLSFNVETEKIQAIFEHWGTLEPIFTYVGKMRASRNEKSLGLISEIISNMDPPKYENWKKWRYEVMSKKYNQLDQLSDKQKEIWIKDHFESMGNISIDSSLSDRPKQVFSLLQTALSEKHVYNDEIDTSNKYQFIQESISNIFNEINQDIEQKDTILRMHIDFLRKDLDMIDDITRYSSLPRVEQAFNTFNGERDIPINKSVKATIELVSKFLNEDAEQRFKKYVEDVAKENRSISTSEPIIKEVSKIIEIKISEIKERYANALNTDIFERYGLDKENTKNLNQFYQKRKEIKKILDLCRISNLNSSLIAMNKIESMDSKKGESLSSVLEDLSTYFEDNITFLQDINNIKEAIIRQDTVVGKRNLAMLVTDNPQILFQVGKYPIGCGSCQNYEGSPDWNKALTGYISDSHTKAMFLIDINELPEAIKNEIKRDGFDKVKDSIHPQDILEASLARSMVKITQMVDYIEEEDTYVYKPVLFIEPTYTKINKGDLSMNKFFNLFAETMISNPMGIRLARGGGNVRLIVPGSNNPYGQYEDCAAGNAGQEGMGIQVGEYEMFAEIISMFTEFIDEEALKNRL